MPTQENGRPLNPTSPRSPIGERVAWDEIVGKGGPLSLTDLADVDPNVTPSKGSLLVGNGSVFVEQPVGTDGYVLTADSTAADGVRWEAGASGGITAAQHESLRQLIHFIDEGPAHGFASGAYKTVVGGLFPTAVTWWTDATQTKKVVEKLITRSGGGATNLKPTPIVWKVYDTDGVTLLQTISDAITYVGVAEANRTRTII